MISNIMSEAPVRPAQIINENSYLQGLIPSNSFSTDIILQRQAYQLKKLYRPKGLLSRSIQDIAQQRKEVRYVTNLNINQKIQELMKSQMTEKEGDRPEQKQKQKREEKGRFKIRMASECGEERQKEGDYIAFGLSKKKASGMQCCSSERKLRSLRNRMKDFERSMMKNQAKINNAFGQLKEKDQNTTFLNGKNSNNSQGELTGISNSNILKQLFHNWDEKTIQTTGNQSKKIKLDPIFHNQNKPNPAQNSNSNHQNKFISLAGGNEKFLSNQQLQQNHKSLKIYSKVISKASDKENFSNVRMANIPGSQISSPTPLQQKYFAQNSIKP